MKPTFIILGLTFLGLQYALWFSSGGLIQAFEIKRSITQLKAANAEQTQRNIVLQADVNDLKQGTEAIEERARNDLGMIKQGEIFYQVAQ